MRVLILVLALGLAVAGGAIALPIGAGPISAQCTGPTASASLPPPDVQFTPPECTVSGVG